MKQLTCEMCGSTDLIKQDGVFVCQSCGIKYSVEEAKKMMVEVEGAVEVTGTVKVDSTDKLNNLYLLARRAKDDNNTEDAAKYYNEIRLYAPNDWEAAFYSVYYTAMSCTIGEIESAAYLIANSIPSVISLIRDHVESQKQNKIYIEIATEAQHVAKLLFNAATETYRGYLLDQTSSGDDERDCSDRTKAAITIYITLGEELKECLDDLDFIKAMYEDGVNLCKSSFYTGHLSRYFDEPIDDIRFEIEVKKVERIRKYWSEHAEEKRNFDNRLAEIKRTLHPLTEQRDALSKKKTALNNKKNEKVPAEKEAYSVSLKIDSLKKEFASLGIFSGKRKKEIQAELESLNTERENLERLSREQRTQMQNDIQEEIRKIDVELTPIKAQIESLKAEEKTITDELNKDR